MTPSILIAAILISTSAAVGAQTAATPKPAAALKAATAPMSDGEVRKVDKAGAKLTLRHGPLLNLDMPAMTMAFRVSDPKLIATVKKGDKVRFVAEDIGGQLTVTRLEAAK